MRIVHEVRNKKPQTGCSGQVYAYKIKFPPPDFPGCQLELLACDNDDEVIYLEGDSEAIVKTLEAMLFHAKCQIDALKEDWAIKRAMITKCNKCNNYFPPEHDCKYWCKNPVA